MHIAHTHGALRTCTPDGAARKALVILLLRPAQAHLSVGSRTPGDIQVGPSYLWTFFVGKTCGSHAADVILAAALGSCAVRLRTGL